jgi:hypothetical protein
MAGSPSDLEPDGWNCLLASLIVQKRVFHQIDADDVSAVELIETTISRLQSTISTTNDENLKQEAQYALGQLLLARVPLDQNSIREAIGFGFSLYLADLFPFEYLFASPTDT